MMAPQNWEKIKLGDVLEKIVGGGTPSKSEPAYWDGDIPWASVKDMEDGVFRLFSTTNSITAEGLLNSSANLIPKGTVVTSTRMGLGRSFMAKIDVAINQDLKALFPNNKIIPEYLLWLLASMKLKLESMGTGTTVKGIRLEQLRDIDIVLPSIASQREIASTISAYDDLIENNTRRIKILEEMAQSLYREWFINFRFPGHEKATFIDSPLGQIPKGWTVVKFTDIADVLSGGTPSTKESAYWDGNIPFFTPKDASANFYVTGTEKNITELGLSKCSSKLYPKDTVFITARGTVGKVVMPATDMAMNQSCYALVGKDGISQPFLFFLTQQTSDLLRKHTGGATFSTIIVDTFKKIDILRPADEVIYVFTDQFKPILEKIRSLLFQNINLRRTRDMLICKLIT